MPRVFAFAGMLTSVADIFGERDAMCQQEL
jgi:hypothetical protein